MAKQPFYKEVSRKYELTKDFSYTLSNPGWGKIPINPARKNTAQYVGISGTQLTINAGYGWDGATWMFDIAKSMRATLVHDALYQIIRTSITKKKKRERFRKLADKEMKRILKKCKVNIILRTAWYYGVRTFGASFVQ